MCWLQKGVSCVWGETSSHVARESCLSRTLLFSICLLFNVFDFPQIGLSFLCWLQMGLWGVCGHHRISRRPGVTNHWVDGASGHMHVTCHVPNSAFCDLRSALFHRVEQLLHTEAHPPLPSCRGSGGIVFDCVYLSHSIIG